MSSFRWPRRRPRGKAPAFLLSTRFDDLSRRGSAAHALSEALKSGWAAARSKLSNLTKIQDPQIHFDEREFNSLGYRLLGQGRLAEAVWVLEINARRFFDSWNAHDSLGEGYMRAGRTKDPFEATTARFASTRRTPTRKGCW
jgi:hypothetical protein